jgi:hypothetical protein
MPIILEATYSKKLGLPNYSSHSYVVSLQTEITDLGQVEAQSAQLYAILQNTVDKELQQVGFLPESADSGSDGGRSAARRYPSSNGSNGHSRPQNGHAARNGHNGHTPEEEWACSEKQRALILRIVDDNRLDKNHVEDMARQLFGVGVVECDKLQASQLIEELLESTGGKRNQGSRWRRPARS